MQCGQHEVTADGCPHGRVGGHGVTDFADHDDVRSLSQTCGQQRGEVHILLQVDLRLSDAGQHVFDGIFQSVDLAATVVQRLQATVHRCGLAAARRAGHKDQTGRVFQQ